MSAANKKKNKKKNNIQQPNNTKKITNGKKEIDNQNKVEEKADSKVVEENLNKENINVEKKPTAKIELNKKCENENKQEKEDNSNDKLEKDNTEKVEKKKEDLKENNKLIVNKENKPEYVEQMIKNKKRKVRIFVCVVILLILIISFSTFFAMFNLNNTNIINGIKIKNIDISNLSNEDANKKINECIEVELTPEIYLKYGENYERTIKAEQIEFEYKIQDAVNNAYTKGRSGNIVENNYSLIWTAIFGKEIELEYTYNEELLNQFVDTINSEIPGVVVEPSYYLEEGKLIINKGIDGIQVKKEELKQNILNSLYNRNYQEIKNDTYKQEIKIPTENKKADSIDMDKIYAEVHTEPQDAYFEKEPYKIYPDVDGIDLAITVEEAKKILENQDKEEYIFELKINKAQKTIDDLGTEAFPYLISSFTTKYDASNRNRSTNLRIAAEKINGKVLMPGEEFSYNQVVGKRTVEAGYKDAKIYADGGVVDGLAGGICQISSTLYNAVLLANLEITERRNHTYTTSYVPAGKDATVVYGTKDFKFKNSRTYPIKIEASVKNRI